MKTNTCRSRSKWARGAALLLIAILTLFTLASCGRGTVELGDKGVSPAAGSDLTASAKLIDVTAKAADDRFARAASDFAIKLVQQAESDNSYMVSPLSVMMALCMTANGAGTETLAQMEALLGGGMSIDELNEYMAGCFKSLCSDNEDAYFSIADSIWLRDADTLKVEDDFLSRCRSYYNAQVIEAPFDDTTLRAINKWVDKSTDGMIKEILNKINDRDMLYLINAIAFDAEWEDIYEDTQIRDGEFTALSGKKQDAEFMWTGEYSYLEGNGATGFIKAYKGGTFSFVGILPDAGVSPSEYLASLDGEKYLSLIKSVQPTEVLTAIPKFKKEFDIELREALSAIGMPIAFDVDNSDFSKMGTVDGKDRLYIGSVIHKTFIEVDEKGTKAGAATAVAMADGAAEPQDPKEVILDRPFVYAIIETATGIPVFIGAVNEMDE